MSITICRCPTCKTEEGLVIVYEEELASRRCNQCHTREETKITKLFCSRKCLLEWLDKNSTEKLVEEKVWWEDDGKHYSRR